MQLIPCRFEHLQDSILFFPVCIYLHIKTFFRSIFCIFRKIVLSLQPENKLFWNMTTLQMNAELFRQLSIIAKDENLMAKLLKYTRKLTAKMEDPTLMSKEEFFARVDEAKKGSSKSFANVDELDKFIRAL